MGRETNVDTDTVVSWLDNIYSDLAELFTSIAAIAAGSAITCSANDSTPGDLETKLVCAEGSHTFSTNNDGGNETREIVAAAATTSLKGHPELATDAETQTGTDTSRVPPVSALTEKLRYHFLL